MELNKPKRTVIIVETPEMFYVRYIERTKHSPLNAARFNKAHSKVEVAKWIASQPYLILANKAEMYGIESNL